MIKDPYPIKRYDSEIWETLLNRAYRIDDYMASILYWYRSVGVQLKLNEKTGYLIVPMTLADYDWGWQDISEWEQEKQWLLPYAKTVAELLIDLRMEEDKKCQENFIL